jgi:predicted transcriptional regulator
LALIGMFIRNASQMSYKQLLIHKAVSGEEIRCFMKTDIVTVPPDISIEELVSDYFYRIHLETFPVCDGDFLLGFICPEQVKQVPREKWDNLTVGDLVKPCSADNTISPQAGAVRALSIMKRTDNSLLMVVDAGQLVGVVTLKRYAKIP